MQKRLILILLSILLSYMCHAQLIRCRTLQMQLSVDFESWEASDGKPLITHFEIDKNAIRSYMLDSVIAETKMSAVRKSYLDNGYTLSYNLMDGKWRIVITMIKEGTEYVPYVADVLMSPVPGYALDSKCYFRHVFNKSLKL